MVNSIATVMQGTMTYYLSYCCLILTRETFAKIQPSQI